MKKILILLVVSFFFTQCTEKEKSATTQTETNVEKPKFPLRYVAANEVNTILETNNDSLIVVNIWAEWCAPCKAEIPSFVRFQNEMKDKKVKFYFVNIDKTSVRETVEKFTNSSEMNNSLFLTAENATGISTLVPEILQGIPITIFVKNGKRENHIGMLQESDLQTKLQSMLP